MPTIEVTNVDAVIFPVMLGHPTSTDGLHGLGWDKITTELIQDVSTTLNTAPKQITTELIQD